MNQIEVYARKEIEVEQRARAPSMAIDHTRAVLYFHDPNAIDVTTAPHEILHIARNWPERVPMLFNADNNSRNAQNIANLDNILEHLVIVPREANYGITDPFARRNDEAARYWNARKWAQYVEPMTRRMSMLLHWLSVHFLVTDAKIRGEAITALRSQHHFVDALGFSTEIGASLNNKARMASITLHYIQGIPSASVVLRLFDPHLPNPIDAPVPVYG